MRRLWAAFTAVIVVSFLVLGWMGVRIYQAAPPIPREVVTTDGAVVIPAGDIEAGPERLAVDGRHGGGLDLGARQLRGSRLDRRLAAPRGGCSCWTSGRRRRARAYAASLSAEEQAPLRARLQKTMRANTFEPSSGVLRIDPARGKAFAANAAHYADVFTRGRPEYAIPSGALTDPVKLRQLSAFFFWTSWAASTNRPGDTVSYTSNWPHEPLVGNSPTGEAVVWTGVSIIMLLAGIGAWSGTTRRGARSRRRGRCPRATRCSATRRRRRSARP